MDTDKLLKENAPELALDITSKYDVLIKYVYDYCFKRLLFFPPLLLSSTGRRPELMYKRNAI